MEKKDVLKNKKIKSRKKHKSISSKGKATFMAAALSVATASTSTAAVINVDNVNCTLTDAITSANNDTATGGCTAGSGADTIILPAGSTITLTSPLDTISSEITIKGNGATVERDPNASEFRIFTTNDNGKLTLDYMTIKGGSEHRGGGVGILGGSGTLINCTITGNSASSLGGGVGEYGANGLTIINSTITNNTSSDKGGGIGADGFAELTLVNSTISGNTAPIGAGIFNGYEVYTYVIHSTITHNTSTGNNTRSASGIYNEDYLYIYSSIVAENTGGVGNCAPANNIEARGHNWFGDATCNGTATSGNLNLDSDLQDNGGLTKTHALLPGSDAIDAAGDCSGLPVSVTTDQREVTRPIDGNGDGVSACDIGAFENQLPDAVDDSAETEENTPVEIDVLNNDFLGDGPRGSLSVSTDPSHGTATVNDGGTPEDPSDDTITYTPDADYSGTDTFEYQLCDSTGDCDNATVTVTINQGAHVFDPPSATKVAYPSGWPQIEWKMVWINDGNTEAQHVLVQDPLDPNLSFINGSLKCTATGASVTQRCEYDSTNNMVIWEGNIAPDPGATDEASASNEVVITFRTTVGAGVTYVENQATGYWDTDGDGDIDSTDREKSVVTDDPSLPGQENKTRASQVVGVPTLSQWAKMIMMALSMLAGYLGLRKEDTA